MPKASSKESSGYFGVYFCAIFMAQIGAILGFFYMANFPSQVFSSQAEYQVSLEDAEEANSVSKPGNAYYIEGDVLRSSSWLPKRELLAADGAQTVKFTEGEINAWIKAKFQAGVPPKNKDDMSILVVPDLPNFALASDGVFYFNLPVSLSAFGTDSDFTISARCDVSIEGLQFNSVSINSAKLPLPNILGAKVMGVLSQSYQSSEEFEIVSAAFSRAKSIKVEEQELVFNLR